MKVFSTGFLEVSTMFRIGGNQACDIPELSTLRKRLNIIRACHIMYYQTLQLMDKQQSLSRLTLT